jgi:hypothetical protein
LFAPSYFSKKKLEELMAGEIPKWKNSSFTALNNSNSTTKVIKNSKFVLQLWVAKV